ncbi:Di-copper centre-containing protein [Ophiobolus disseminans]|uniref:Di-copper centre-containing protein n=1 Tax=Ophiobolus disseminans TaxID=1469910 RepID=A0A6A7AAR3_9PLEO|nr:Di-copper centre-containing protein [Ophiobolus disseminans]
MRTSFFSATLAFSAGVSALPQNIPETPLPPALPLQQFETQKFSTPLTPADILARVFQKSDTEEPSFRTLSAADDVSIAATCANPRVRVEWDSYSDSDKQAYVNAIRCLQTRPASGQFSQSRSRYEDLVALHQNLTPNVHGSAKFLLWHRYFLWMFEDIIRSECSFDRALPWFDETRYAGRFSQSSIFSSQWFGAINRGGNCVEDGQFANLAINVGPGSSNSLHCLARNGDDSKTQYTNSGIVDGCNNEGDYANMASCAEGGAHAWGHNGIGAVMQDTFASPADPIFFLHHAFIDRNFRIWQNKDQAYRVNNINGRDVAGNPLTLDTTVNVYDIRPTVQIRDILDTTSEKLCYKYSY